MTKDVFGITWRVWLAMLALAFVVAIGMVVTGHAQDKPKIEYLRTVGNYTAETKYDGIILAYQDKHGKPPGSNFPKPLESELACRKSPVPCRYNFFNFVGKGRITSDGSVLLEQGTTRRELIRAAMRSLIRSRDEWETRARRAENELQHFGTITRAYGLRVKVVKSGTIYPAKKK